MIIDDKQIQYILIINSVSNKPSFATIAIKVFDIFFNTLHSTN
jgi:hypothetical protein